MTEEENDSESEMWKRYRDIKKENKQWHRENTLPKEMELLKKLNDQAKLHIMEEQNDGAGGTKLVIEVHNERGLRVIDFYLSNGFWKVRRSNAEGYGAFRMCRYFQLIAKEENNV